jgi:TRAP-type transport system periplasmic protein
MPHRRALLAAATALPFAARAQTRWQLASGFAEGNYHTRNLRLFVDEVRQTTAGALDIALHPNGALLPQPQILRGVQQAQVQVGEILLTAYANEDAIFDVDQVPGVVASMEDARRLMAARGPAIEQRLARRGMHLLYLAPWPLVGMASQAPVPDAAAFRGLRLRTYSPISTRFGQLMGATAVLLPAPEVAQGFATGMVNAQLTTAPVAADTQAWDTTRVFTRINLATSNNGVIVNRRAFDALPGPQQEALRTAADRAAARAWSMAAEADETALSRMRERGMQVMEMSPALAESLREPARVLTEDWLQRAGPEGRALLDAYRARG